MFRPIPGLIPQLVDHIVDPLCAATNESKFDCWQICATSLTADKFVPRQTGACELATSAAHSCTMYVHCENCVVLKAVHDCMCKDQTGPIVRWFTVTATKSTTDFTKTVKCTLQVYYWSG